MFISDQRKFDYFKKLEDKINFEYENKNIYPKKTDIYNALELTPYEKVKVVILGQDPYHNPNQAHGLAFSVNHGVKIPPSLRNIYKELNSDLGVMIPDHGNLVDWANEGVLLLNTVLTVRENEPNSHKNLGWEDFTDNLIKLLNDRSEPLAFILWGNNAKSKKKFINNSNHFIVEGVHPSPLSASRGFFGSKPFSQVNEFLIKNNKKPVNWCLKNIDLFNLK
ncbi:uracil-DNA glycosylase [Mycoplasmatota bacterium WC44]